MDSSSETTGEEWKLKGNDLYKIKDYKGAVEAYTAAISHDNTSVSLYTLYTNRAAALLMTQNYKEAIQDCEDAIKLDCSNSKAYFRKATALKGLGFLDQALESLRSGLSFDPSSQAAQTDYQTLLNAQSSIASAKSLVERRDFRAALKVLTTLTQSIGSSFRDVNILKVECLLELHPNRPEEAYNITNQMMRTSTVGDFDLLRLRAKCFYVMGDMENSVKHCQSALRLDPDNAPIRTFYRKVKSVEENKEIGNAAFKRGQYQEAIEAWTTAIEVDTTADAIVSKIYLNRATALSKLKRHEEAVVDCTRALKADPGYGKALQRRGECYYALGGADNLPKAISDFESALEYQSDEASIKQLQTKIKNAKVALKNVNKKDLYKILGCTRDADEDEIRKAYRKAALRCHPDKQAGKSEEEKSASEAQFKDIGLAYEILSDSEKRQRYDGGADLEDIDNPNAGHSHGGGHGGIDPNDLFRMFMHQQHMGRGGF